MTKLPNNSVFIAMNNEFDGAERRDIVSAMLTEFQRLSYEKRIERKRLEVMLKDNMFKKIL